MRIGMMVGVGAAFIPVFGWPVVPWLACMITLQLGERAWILRCDRHRVLRQRAAWGLALIVLNSLLFAGIGMAAVLTGDFWAMLSGVLVMAGVLMNAGPSTGTSKLAYIAAAGSITVFAWSLPVMAYRSGATAGEVWALSVCVLLLFAASLSTRSFAVRAFRAERRANAAKSSALTTISHVIRTPLNGVLGMAQAMAADDLSETQRARLETICESGDTLLIILNDVLDFSKIEAGKLELEEVDFELSSLRSAVHAAFEAVAAAKGLKCESAWKTGSDSVLMKLAG